jgi:hypothetical protein
VSPTDIKDSATKDSTTKESATKREIQVEIPVADVNRQTDSLIQKYQKCAFRLPARPCSGVDYSPAFFGGSRPT